MSKLKSALVASTQMLTGTTKDLWRRIDWDVVQIIVLVGMVPAMILIGALFPAFLTPYYED